jgi:hypothetical protein
MKIEAAGWSELLALTNQRVDISQKMVLFIDNLVRTSHLIHVRERDQQDAHLFSLIYSN